MIKKTKINSPFLKQYEQQTEAFDKLITYLSSSELESFVTSLTITERQNALHYLNDLVEQKASLDKENQKYKKILNTIVDLLSFNQVNTEKTFY